MAAAFWWGTAVVSEPAEQPVELQPAYGLLALLRKLERKSPEKPRIGRSRRLREDIVRLGQDPFLAFPTQEITQAQLNDPQPKVRSPVLGFFGPQGALPLNTTEEVLRWTEAGDESFVAFTDIFASRFIQLFYRAWADVRPIVQFDHANDDRFQKYLLSLAGLGTKNFRDQSDILDTFQLSYTSLFLGRIKSPRRLQQIIQLYLKTKTEVEEMVPSWMEFEPDSLSRLGQQGSTLGQNVHLGSRIQSVGEKIRIHLHSENLEAYRRLLPGSGGHIPLEAIVQSYLGQTMDVDVCVWLPQSEVPPTQLGTEAALGWMACIAPDDDTEGEVCGVTYAMRLAGDFEDTDRTAA